MKRSLPLPAAIAGTAFVAVLATLWLLETRRPLRRRVERRAQHTGRNLAVAALSAAAIRVSERPVTDRFTRLVVRNRIGLLQQAALPPWLELATGVCLLDYTLYLWHVLTHKVPLLWRFHVAHHADLDLDATTALRFHFGEMVLSVPWRAAQVVLLGVNARTLSVWQTSTLLAILFHHSNIEIPPRLERWLCRIVTTPRMHGIHHSIVREETDSNWSTIFSFPDYLHGTIRLNVPHDALTIGVPAYRTPDDLGFEAVVLLPFVEQRPTWKLPRNGEPVRRGVMLPRAVLADAAGPVPARRGWAQSVS